MNPTYAVHWSQSQSLETIEHYVQQTLNGVDQERIVAISHAMIPRGAFGEQPCLYSVLITIRDR